MAGKNQNSRYIDLIAKLDREVSRFHQRLKETDGLEVPRLRDEDFGRLTAHVGDFDRKNAGCYRARARWRTKLPTRRHEERVRAIARVYCFCAPTPETLELAIQMCNLHGTELAPGHYLLKPVASQSQDDLGSSPILGVRVSDLLSIARSEQAIAEYAFYGTMTDRCFAFISESDRVASLIEDVQQCARSGMMPAGFSSDAAVFPRVESQTSTAKPNVVRRFRTEREFRGHLNVVVARHCASVFRASLSHCFDIATEDLTDLILSAQRPQAEISHHESVVEYSATPIRQAQIQDWSQDMERDALAMVDTMIVTLFDLHAKVDAAALTTRSMQDLDDDLVRKAKKRAFAGASECRWTEAPIVYGLKPPKAKFTDAHLPYRPSPSVNQPFQPLVYKGDPLFDVGGTR